MTGRLLAANQVRERYCECGHADRQHHELPMGHPAYQPAHFACDVTSCICKDWRQR